MPPAAPLSLTGMPPAVPGKMLACGMRTGRPADVWSPCTGQPAGPQVSPPEAQVLPLDAQESPLDALLAVPAAPTSAPGARQVFPPNTLQVCAPEPLPFLASSPAPRAPGLEGRLGRNQLDTGCAAYSAAAVRLPLRWLSAAMSWLPSPAW